jgi:hypothetical protein
MGVFREDAPHDRGLVLHEHELALSWPGSVAVGEAAGRQTSLNAPAHAAASVALEVLKLLGLEHRAHAIHDGMHHALARRLDSHPTPISLAGPA